MGSRTVNYAEYSEVTWPLATGTKIYVQVDSWSDSPSGAVTENHEILRGGYNNIGGLLSTWGVNGAGGGWVVRAAELAVAACVPVLVFSRLSPALEAHKRPWRSRDNSVQVGEVQDER
jgi:hypothetical protein